MNLHTFDELDDMAWQMLEGEATPIKIASLEPTERLTALEMTFAMALCKLGVLSPSASAAFKLKIYHENKQFAVEFNHLYEIYNRWIEETRDISCLRTQYDKAIRAGDKDEVLRLGSIIIDKLTKENVHYKMYERYCSDKDCRAKSEQAAREVTNSMEDFDSRLPYSTIIDSLFRFFKPEWMVRIWEPLGVDYPAPTTTKVPKKQDDTAWAAKMVKKNYGIKDNKKLSDVQKERSMPECKQDVSVQSV